MSSPVRPDPEAPATPAPSSTPPSSADGSPPVPPPAPPATPTPWRAPETAPAWARGKNPEEILGIANQMYGVLERFNQQNVVPQPTPAPAPAPAQPQYGLPADDFVTGDVVRQYVDQTAQAFQPMLQQTLAAQAAMAHSFARQQHQDAFTRFGPEIEAELARLPVGLRTLDNITTIVDVVRGRHVNELAEEKARELAAQLGPTLRSNGGVPVGAPSSPSLTLQNTTVPEEWRQKALRAGLDDATIADFARANNMTVERFYQQFNGGLIQAAVADSPANRPTVLPGR